MSVHCGIDLGTTYSAISWYDADRRLAEPIRLESAGGRLSVPSVVYFEAGGNVIVGARARDAALRYPERVVADVKRFIGTDFKTPPIDGKAYTSQEVAAEILKWLKVSAERYLGERAADVVIAIPPWFEEPQEAATREAADSAGLNVLELMPEPYAAALAFVADRTTGTESHNLIVCDLGGGSFDITLMTARCKDAGVGLPDLDPVWLAEYTDPRLGGIGWDCVLARLAVDKAMVEHGIQDPHTDLRAKAALLKNCEHAKHILGQSPSCAVQVDLHGHYIEISRTEFEREIHGMLSQTEGLLRQVLREAQQHHGLLTEKRIREMEAQGTPRAELEGQKVQLLLCGGTARMPIVERCITQMMGESPLRHRNPDLLVTLGAAYRAYLVGATADQETTSTEPTAGRLEARAPAVAETTLTSDASEIRAPLSTAYVLDMFHELNLPVTDDSQQIETRVRELQPSFLEKAKSNNPRQRDEANRWFKTVAHLQNNRSELLDVIRQIFFQLADVGLDVSLMVGDRKLTHAVLLRLKQVAQKEYNCDPPLALVFVNEYLQERGIEIGDLIVLPLPSYDPVLIKEFLEQRVSVKLREFCFELEHRLSPVYAYENLNGNTPAVKSIDLVQIAKRHEQLGDVVYYLAKHWVRQSNPRVFVKGGLVTELDVFRQELLARGDQNRAREVVILQEKLRPKSWPHGRSHDPLPPPGFWSWTRAGKFVAIVLLAVTGLLVYDFFDLGVIIVENAKLFFQWLLEHP